MARNEMDCVSTKWGDSLSNVEVRFHEMARIGVIDEMDRDPTLVIWDNDGDSAFILHLGEIDWTRPSDEIFRQIVKEATR